MELRLTSHETIALQEGESLYRALKRAGVYLVASCGGKGTCGKCKVKVLDGSRKVISYGKLRAKEREAGMVLACQTIPESDCLIEVPKESRLIVGDKIAIAKTKELAEYLRSFGVGLNLPVKRVSLELPHPSISDNISDFERLKRVLDEKGLSPMRFSYEFIRGMGRTLRAADWKVDFTYVKGESGVDDAIFLSAPGSCGGRYGISVDIGTTTVVVYLVDLVSGEVLDVGSTYNSQMRHGDDVITRIVYATERGGLDELRQTVVLDVNTIIASFVERRGVRQCEIEAATIAGNTTMSHIFWGLDPGSIREEPYIPAVNFFPSWEGATARLDINTQSPVYTVPCVASYVGGDIVAGVLASKMHRNEEIALFMDIGTNGEIAIGNNEWIMTAACSMGPCFEGSGIGCGMRATEGAIESVEIDCATCDPAMKVIGGGSPLGICGSGMIDVLSEMFLSGIIDQKGKFVVDRSQRIREGENGFEYLIHRDETVHKDIALTEVDVENLLRAKAALYSGITTLLSEAGLSLDDLKRVYIAGGFGNYLNVEKAIILGMLPDIPKERFVYLGNTSITGAYLCLLSEELRHEAEGIAASMTYIELSVSRRFMDEYMSALFLPHTDMEQFPTVGSLLMSRMSRETNGSFSKSGE
jgi:uncharacterized 2Fe-2S/4Fe-4S cluster protein (DUF4445 family)